MHKKPDSPRKPIIQINAKGMERYNYIKSMALAQEGPFLSPPSQRKALNDFRSMSSPTLPHEHHQQKHLQQKQVQKGGTSVNNSIRDAACSPEEILELFVNMCNRDSFQQQYVINRFVCKLLKAELSFLVLPTSYPLLPVVNMMGTSPLGQNVTYPLSETLFTAFHKEQKVSFTGDLIENHRILILQHTKIQVKTFIAIPVRGPRGIEDEDGDNDCRPLFLVVAVNKKLDLGANRRIKLGKHLQPTCEFTQADATKVRELMFYVIPFIHRNLCHKSEEAFNSGLTSVLSVSRDLLQLVDDLEGLLKHFMIKSREIMKAERCGLFLVNLASRCLQGAVLGKAPSEYIYNVKVPLGYSTMGDVISSGTTINIIEFCADMRYLTEIDESMNAVTKSLLSVPIRDCLGHVRGALEFYNKDMDAKGFNLVDEEIASTLSILATLFDLLSQLKAFSENSLKENG